MTKRERTYIRFVSYHLVEAQRQRLGVFQAIEAAKSCDFAPAWALKEIREVYGWFKSNLAVPSQFARIDRKGHSQPCLSWFKPAAEDHIRQMHRLKSALESCGVHVDVLTTRRPGQIVWQDRHQIVAEPGSRRF